MKGLNEHFSIFYGENKVYFKIPRDWRVINVLEPKHIPGLKSFSKEVRRVIKLSGLSKVVKKGRGVSIIVDDDSRPTPVKEIIPHVINEVRLKGVREEDISVVIALGMHHQMSEKALKSRLGEEVYEKLKVINHDPFNDLKYVCDVKSGVEVWMNRFVVESNVKIGVGTIAMHLLGYSGGPKIVMPGISDYESIKQIHLEALINESARRGNLEGNVMYERMSYVADKLGLSMVINTVFNSKGEVVKVLGGDFRKVMKEGSLILNRMFNVSVSELADITIVSGHPLNENLFQSLKGLFLADLVTRPKGVIIHVTPATRGVGPYRTLDGKTPLELSLSELIEETAEGNVNPSEAITPYILRSVQNRKKLVIVSNRRNKWLIEKIGLEYAETIDEAIDKIHEKVKKAKITLIPRGSSMFGASRSFKKPSLNP